MDQSLWLRRALELSTINAQHSTSPPSGLVYYLEAWYVCITAIDTLLKQNIDELGSLLLLFQRTAIENVANDREVRRSSFDGRHQHLVIDTFLRGKSAA
jgi:hypothetical protein